MNTILAELPLYVCLYGAQGKDIHMCWAHMHICVDVLKAEASLIPQILYLRCYSPFFFFKDRFTHQAGTCQVDLLSFGQGTQPLSTGRIS